MSRLTLSAGTVDGVAGEVLEPSDVERGRPTWRKVVGTFRFKAQAVIVASRGIVATRMVVAFKPEGLPGPLPS